MTTHEAAFQAVLKTLKNNRIMVDTREDGVYIRLAGKEEKGEAFTYHFANVYPIGEKSNTHNFAERELEILSKSATDPDNRPIIEPFTKEIIALCEAFGKSGQSGGSAPYTATAISQAVKKLLLEEPIMPMTGIDDEWNEVGRLSSKNEKECVYQNRRCSNLFKNSEGKACYLDAIIWKDQNGMTTSGQSFLRDGTVLHPVYSRNYVKSFPFTPKSFYIDVTCEEVAPNDFERYIKAPKQLERVWKYYNRYS